MTFFYSGFGVFATKSFTRGSLLLEYAGEVIRAEEAMERMKRPPFYSSYMMELKPHKIWYFVCFMNNARVLLKNCIVKLFG